MTPEGEYVTSHKDSRGRHLLSLGTLNVGRFGIINGSISYLASAVTIAIRLSKVENSCMILSGCDLSSIIIISKKVILHSFPYLI